MNYDSLYCSKWRKIPKSHSDLDLGPAKPNIELLRLIFIYYNVFKFHIPRSISFGVIVQKHTHTHKNTHLYKDAHKESDEYSTAAFCKIATIFNKFENSVIRN